MLLVCLELGVYALVNNSRRPLQTYLPHRQAEAHDSCAPSTGGLVKTSVRSAPLISYPADCMMWEKLWGSVKEGGSARSKKRRRRRTRRCGGLWARARGAGAGSQVVGRVVGPCYLAVSSGAVADGVGLVLLTSAYTA